MDRTMPINSIISTESACFTIKKCIGEGASCTVYLAERNDRTEHLLKEYNPKSVALIRDEKGTLSLQSQDEKQVSLFHEGFERFKEAAERQKEIRKDIPSLKNETSNIQDVFEANGTIYIDMTVFHGDVYSRVAEQSLLDLFKRMKTLVVILQAYHSHGYLHLDIKPDNIFTLPQTCEMLMLFDFDSVVKKDDALHTSSLSYSQSWAAPEQLQLDRRRICEATDFYPVGEMIYFKLFGHHSTPDDHRSFSKYPFERNSGLFENVPEDIYPKIEELLRRTLCSDVKKRYSNAQKLIDALDELVQKADTGKPRLVSSIPPALASFVGRSNELQIIREKLSTNNLVFLRGIGGIGKSEIARQYASLYYQKEYDIVLYGVYEQSLELLFADDRNVRIANISRRDNEKENDYGKRKLSLLRDLSSDRVLLIIDNMNVDTDPLLRAVSTLSCKTIITSRNDYRDNGYEQIEIDAFSDLSEIRALFDQNYQHNLLPEEDKAVEKLIDFVERHTMAVELLAKQMRASRILPSKMLSMLVDTGLRAAGKERIQIAKDRIGAQQNAYAHIQSLFNITNLSKEQENILKCLSFLPVSGIKIETFHDWCGLDDYTDIDDLIRTGWVRQTVDTEERISLHPIIADIMRDHIQESLPLIEKLVLSATDSIKAHKNDVSEVFASMIPAYISIADIICNQKIETKATAEYLKTCANAVRIYGYPNKVIRYGNYSVELFNKLYGESCEKSIRLLLMVSYLYAEQHLFQDARRIAERAKDLVEKHYGESILLIDAYDRCGVVEIEAHNFKKAEEILAKEAEMINRICPDDHRRSVNSPQMRSHLAIIAIDRGDYATAIEVYNELLPIYENRYGENSQQAINTLGNIASAYNSLGMFDKAEEYYRRALHRCEKSSYKESIPYARYLKAIGSVLQSCGKRQEAADAYNTAYQMLKTLLGKNDYRTKDALLHLANYEIAIGELSKARKDLNDVLELQVQQVGTTHRDVAQIYSLIARVDLESRFFHDAETRYSNAYSIYLETLGPEHRHTLMALRDLGVIHTKLGKMTEAQEELDKSWKGLTRLYGATNNDAIFAGIYYTDLKTAQEQYSEARRLLEELEKNSKNNVENIQVMVGIQVRIGMTYFHEHDYPRAKEYWEAAFETNSQVRQKRDTSFATILGNLALAHAFLGNFQDALRYSDQEREVIKNSFGERTLRYASALSRYGIVLRKCGSSKEAETVHRRAMCLAEQLLGQDSIQYGEYMNDLGKDLLRIDAGEAKAALLEAVKVFQKRFGPDHQTTKKILQELALLQES